MKRIIYPLILLLLAACQHDDVLPEATSAAKEVYLQYADRKDLTVALIGNYQGYNAVMLQAQTKEDWLQLCEEFGVRNHVDSEALDTSRVSGLTIASVNTANYNSLEDFEPHSDSVIREAVSHISNSTIREAVTQLPTAVPFPYESTHAILYPNVSTMSTAYWLTRLAFQTPPSLHGTNN